MTAAQQEAVVRQYAASTGRLRESLVTAIRRLFVDLDNYRDDDADVFVEQAVPVVLGAQAAMAAVTDAYLAQLLAVMLGVPVAPVGILLDAALRGVEPSVVYRRPFEQVWTELSTGKSLTEAVTAGEQRAVSLASTDLQLARTHASRDAMQAHDQVVGYRRVLIGEENCGLCVVASTQRYRKGDLLPIHPACDCQVAVIVGDEDPGQVINGPLLEAAHEAIAERFGRSDAGARDPIDYRKALLVRTHSELGPVLTVADHTFTSAADIPAL